MIALGSNHEFPFIQGLRVAKTLLLGLKEKKLKENIPPQPIASSLLKQQPQQQPEILKQQSKAAQSPQRPESGSREMLQQRLNEMGKQLYECNTENETYQAVFDSMSDYYQENYKIIEENDKLKRNAYSLREKIDEFKNKIQHNLQLTANHRLQDTLIRQLTTEQLRECLLAENNRAQQTPLPRYAPLLPTNAIIYEEEKEEEQSGMDLNLRWQWLSKQVARKPAAGRKQAADEEQKRKYADSSQVYNL